MHRALRAMRDFFYYLCIMEDYLSQLNDAQRRAVAHMTGPELVIAGAGSGKTRVLTYKIVHLLAQGYEPWRILALTFTNKAAREMRERIEGLAGEKTARKLWMGTFHSIFARILRTHADCIGFKSSFTIYDTADSKSLVKMIIKDMGLDDKVYKPATVLSAISNAKNALVSPEAYAIDRELMDSDRRSKRPETVRIYHAYRDRCAVAGAMDFDDLLYYTNVLLRDNPDLLNHYREFFRYVLVDEYQDTNFAQHLIVQRLTEGQGNLCVVGDDAQSIYSFRGANIANILNLKRAYPDLSIFKLEQNYRSTRNIVNAAGSLIEKNKGQIPKHVFSDNETGAPVEVVQSYSDYEESFLVANRISQVHMAGGDGYDEFAVLYRTNAQSRILEEQLRKRNIPYRIYGGLSFYQRKEVKDATAYFRMSLNPDDDEALKRIINFPSRGIGDTTLGKLVHAAVDAGVSIWQVICDRARFSLAVNSGTLKKLNDFRELINEFIQKNASGADAYDVASYIIGRTRLLAMLVSDRTPESVSKQENLQELLAGVQEFVAGRLEAGQEDVSLATFMSEVSLATDQDSDSDVQGESVTLMTVHAAKGLEFANVFVVGVEEELFPSAMASSSPAEIEEERRLLYVAITRAKKFCMLSYASSRFRNGQTATCRPSRFIADIDPQFLRAATGTTLSAPVNPIANYRSSFHSSSRPVRPAESRSSLRDIPARRPAAPAKPAATPSASMPQHTADELREGMRVEHSKFGKGTITLIDNSMADARVTVEFDNTGRRVLLLKFARFSIL